MTIVIRLPIICIRVPSTISMALVCIIAIDWTIEYVLYTCIARGMQAIAILRWTLCIADAMKVIDIGISSTLPYGAMQHIGACAIYSASSSV